MTGYWILVSGYWWLPVSELESIGISILGTRMNTDYQVVKSYKNQISVKICENLCPN
jgi:hypothetical protein